MAFWKKKRMGLATEHREWRRGIKADSEPLRLTDKTNKKPVDDWEKQEWWSGENEWPPGWVWWCGGRPVHLCSEQFGKLATGDTLGVISIKVLERGISRGFERILLNTWRAKDRSLGKAHDLGCRRKKFHLGKQKRNVWRDRWKQQENLVLLKPGEESFNYKGMMSSMK